MRGAFYFWKNENGPHDLILFTGDSQSQTIEGQYEIADRMLDFSQKHKVKTIITIGGYRMETENKPNVFVAATDQALLDKALAAETGIQLVRQAGGKMERLGRCRAAVAIYQQFHRIHFPI